MFINRYTHLHVENVENVHSVYLHVQVHASEYIPHYYYLKDSHINMCPLDCINCEHQTIDSVPHILHDLRSQYVYIILVYDNIQINLFRLLRLMVMFSLYGSCPADIRAVIKACILEGFGILSWIPSSKCTALNKERIVLNEYSCINVHAARILSGYFWYFQDTFRILLLQDNSTLY